MSSSHQSIRLLLSFRLVSLWPLNSISKLRKVQFTETNTLAAQQHPPAPSHCTNETETMAAADSHETIRIHSLPHE